MPPQRLAKRPLTEPHPSRLDPQHLRRAEILAVHEGALGAGRPGYLDPDSGFVRPDRRVSPRPRLSEVYEARMRAAWAAARASDRY